MNWRNLQPHIKYCFIILLVSIRHLRTRIAYGKRESSPKSMQKEKRPFFNIPRTHTKWKHHPHPHQRTLHDILRLENTVLHKLFCCLLHFPISREYVCELKLLRSSGVKQRKIGKRWDPFCSTAQTPVLPGRRTLRECCLMHRCLVQVMPR